MRRRDGPLWKRIGLNGTFLVPLSGAPRYRIALGKGGPCAFGAVDERNGMLRVCGAPSSWTVGLASLCSAHAASWPFVFADDSDPIARFIDLDGEHPDDVI